MNLSLLLLNYGFEVVHGRWVNGEGEPYLKWTSQDKSLFNLIFRIKRL